MRLEALIFVPALVGAVIFGFLFALFLAHHYLTVLQGTAAGARHVTWLSEPILDHFWKVFYLAWLIGLWLGPAWLLGRWYAGGGGPLWVKYAVPLGVFWVCYPVSQLSSLSGPTIWLPLVPEVFDRLARKPLVVLGFLACSAVVLAGFGLGFYWTFRADGMERLVAGSVLLVLAVLSYARLLGRLAYALVFTRSVFGRRRKKTRPADADEPRTRAAEEPSVADEDGGFAQPSDLPPLETPVDGPLTGYDVRFDDGPKPAARKRVVAEAVEPEPRRRFDEGDDGEYAVNRAEVEPDDDRAPRQVVRPSSLAEEIRLRGGSDAPKPRGRVWTAELFAFLGQPETWASVGMLTAMCFAVGGMVRIARAFNPAAEDG